ncbi:hypothetical protein F3Y22_tig00116995pilonHSYRG00067 [Hibiscus syriacus]|uniref:AP2/ERF domain-containing protein n=1 Tax=Hibiscus syriacus TaxID=106335 RepID=A0A6A2XLT0_HIBSY|nr:hypothetical protein F3Y22_tig00116995pilonHSYRG00067 [Hibiscus syriacus]
MGKRKAEISDVDEEEKTNYGVEEMTATDANVVAVAAALSRVRRARKRFVGVRQRPSGRWVAEIKDTIQKIRVWLKERNDTASSPTPMASVVSNSNVNEHGNEGDTVCFDGFLNVPEDCSTSSSDFMLENFGSNSADSISTHNVDVGPNEEIDKEGIMDFLFVDSFGLSICDTISPFEIAEELVEPMVEQQQEDINGDDTTCMLSETMKRMQYERKFSASLYAFNGIPE